MAFYAGLYGMGIIGENWRHGVTYKSKNAKIDIFTPPTLIIFFQSLKLMYMKSKVKQSDLLEISFSFF